MFSPCSELVIFMYLTCNSMNNLSSYCGLVDIKIRASEKDLPVHMSRNILDGGIFEFKPPAVGIVMFKYSEKATKIR